MQTILTFFILLATFAISTFGASITTTTLVVDSKNMWNLSQNKYLKGDVLQITVADTEKWTDWYIETDAAGYANTFHVSTRFANSNLFALVCCAGSEVDESCAAVGKNGVITMDKDATLSCFANDNEYMYWNNKGSIIASVSIVSRRLAHVMEF